MLYIPPITPKANIIQHIIFFSNGMLGNYFRYKSSGIINATVADPIAPDILIKSVNVGITMQTQVVIIKITDLHNIFLIIRELELWD